MTTACPTPRAAAAHSENPIRQSRAGSVGSTDNELPWTFTEADLTANPDEEDRMSFNQYAPPEPPDMPAKPDLYSDPGIRAAIAQREAAVLADVHARNLAAIVAQHEAGAEQRIEAIQKRIFNQVAVGGVRHGRS